MNLRILISIILGVVVLMASTCYAIAPVALTPGVSNANSKLSVESGGIVLAVDYSKRIIRIDGITYTIPLTGLIIHNETKARLSDQIRLLQGMEIRFIANRYNYSNALQIQEVWITKVQSNSNTR